jgi:S-adenosylmethionine decarboxylase
MSGCEWVIEAHGCDPATLADLVVLCALFQRLVEEMDLHPAADPQWHQFAGGGITGLALLKESHLACHTFPEYGSLCLNVFCCRPRPDWDFEEHLMRQFGARSVEVRKLDRPYTR